MARWRAPGFLLACGRRPSAPLRSFDFVPSPGLFGVHGKSAVQSSKHFSVLCKELDPWKCCLKPSYFGVTVIEKPLEMCSISALHHRLFSSASTDTTRNPSFSTVILDDVRHFTEILDHKNVIQDEDRLLAANVDWMRKYKGSSRLLLLPKNNEEVSKILRYCNSRCLAVVPQGGNTGLVGGSVPVYDEVQGNYSEVSCSRWSGYLKQKELRRTKT